MYIYVRENKLKPQEFKPYWWMKPQNYGTERVSSQSVSVAYIRDGLVFPNTRTVFTMPTHDYLLKNSISMFTCVTVSPSVLSSPIPFLDTRLSLIFIHFAWLLFFSEIILLPFHLCSKFSLCAHSEGVCRKEYKSAQKKRLEKKRGRGDLQKFWGISRGSSPWLLLLDICIHYLFSWVKSLSID